MRTAGTRHPQDFAAAVNCFRSGRLAEAEALCTHLLKRTPANGDVMHLLGVVHARRGDLTSAEHWIGHAIRVAPRNANFHNSYGNVLADLSRWPDAANAYRHALRLDGRMAEAHNNLGTVLETTGDLDGAVTALQQALRCNARYPEAWFNLANVLKRLGRVQEAEAAFLEAIQLKPDYLKAFNNYGVFLLDQQRYADAVQQFDRSAALDPGNAHTYLNRGIAWHKLRKYEAALADFEAVLRLSPEQVDAVANIGLVAYELGDFGAAVAQYQWVLQRDPQHVAALMTLASICFTQGFWDDWRVMLEAAEQASTGEQLYEVRIYRALGAFLANAPDECERFLRSSDALQALPSPGANGRFIRAYYVYLNALLGYRAAHRALYATIAGAPVYVVGDSHALALHGVAAGKQPFQARLVLGVKAWHLAREQASRFKTAFAAAVASLPRGAHMVVAAGEIDCRPDEGILQFLKKQPQDLQAYLEGFLTAYVQYVRDLARTRELTVSFCGVPEPAYDLAALTAEDKTLLFQIIEAFNENLARVATAQGCGFIDLYHPTRDPNERGRGLHHLDGYHLEPGFFAALVSSALEHPAR